MVKLKEIAIVRTGVYFKSSPSADTVYLQVGDFDRQGRLVGVNLKPTVEVSLKLERHVLEEEDLLLAAKGDVNFCAMVSRSYGRCVASPSFLVIRVEDKARFLPAYVCGFLNQSYVQITLAAQAKGSAIASLSKSVVEELEIPALPVEQQKLCVQITELQRRAQYLYRTIAAKRKQLEDYKLLKVYRNER